MRLPACLDRLIRSVCCLSAAFGMIVAGTSVRAQDGEIDPFGIDLKERVDVRLVLIDVTVLHKDGRTATGLTIDDFQVDVDGRAVRPDTLDVDCSDEAVPAPKALRAGQRRRPDLQAVSSGNQFVAVVDYMHLRPILRPAVIDQLRMWVRDGMAEGDRLMIAALNGGLRIESAMTDDRDALLATLDRMDHDLSLTTPSFAHLHEGGFFGGLDALFTTLQPMTGRKAMLFFSMVGHVGVEPQYDALAAAAAEARCSIYTVEAVGQITDNGMQESPYGRAVPASPG